MQLKEKRDYILDENGNMVFSRYFLLRRGYCCLSNCTNCPYEQEKNPDVPFELREATANEVEIYDGDIPEGLS